MPREKFVGPGPWRVFGGRGTAHVASDDPAVIYQDSVIALTESRPINNGQPSLHAYALSVLQIQPGETVIHVGTGTGYYTAILSQLAGTSGSVYGFEVDPEMTARAEENLREYQNVQLEHRSGARPPLPEADVIYVSAGATDPLPVWLDALRTGGRLLFPLTGENGSGGMLLVTSRGGARYDARFLCGAQFIDCTDARNKRSAQAVTKAFARGGLEKVCGLQRDGAEHNCWCAGDDWCLTTEA